MVSKRVGAWLCVALVSVAGCSIGDDVEERTAGPGPTPGPGPNDQGAVPGSDPATGTVTDEGPGVPGPVDGSGAAPGSTVADTSTTSTDSSVPTPAGVGAYAPFYLRAAESGQILLDVRSQTGAEPRAGTLDHVRRVLGQVSGKPVELVGEDLGGDGRQWSPESIRELADRSGPAQSRDAAVLRVLFLRGGFADDDTVLGVTVRSDVAAIFSDRVDEAGGALGNRPRIEAAVTLHEVGHLLGLVDLFLDTGRDDPDHPNHSPNSRSVMYYAVESTLVGSILTGGPPTDFDADDLADLAAIRRG